MREVIYCVLGVIGFLYLVGVVLAWNYRERGY